MNILRWNRKNQKKPKLRTPILFIFTLIMSTFAWFAYTRILEPTLNMHLSAWDMEYYIGTEKKTNPISIEIPVLYPTMDEQTIVVDIVNNGETKADIEYQVKSLTIGGITYQAFAEGITPTSDKYITIAPPVFETEEVCKSAITNDITKFPFTIDVEYSAQINAVTENDYGTRTPGEGYLKITVNWIGDNDKLDSEWGHIVGEYLASSPEGTPAMSIELSIDSYQANPDGETIETTMPQTSTTRPYLPDGYTRVPGTSLTTGLVIEDTNGNQYVWVEVPKTSTVYKTAGVNLTTFTTDSYTKVEADLRSYVSSYSTRNDEHFNYDAIGVSAPNYETLKQNMLKSIYDYGGFYIGRYETGLEGEPRTKATSTTPSDTPVIKANAYPYNWVTTAQANTIASRLKQTNYTTSLLFGIQWDLTLKYLETKGISRQQLTTDSLLCGNYLNNSYVLTNSKAKYNQTATGWLDAIPFEKNENQEVLTASGSNSGFCMQNIYDLAGNLSEWTYNVSYDSSISNYVGGNGGSYITSGTSQPANYYGTYNTRTGAKNIGFRIALFSEISATSAWGE